MKRQSAKATAPPPPGSPTLYTWVSKNNPALEKEYGKGWWDSVEFYYSLLDRFPGCDARVIGTYVMQTPPPTEDLLMPVVRLRLPTASVVLKHDFSFLPPEWTVCVANKSRNIPPVCGLFDTEAVVPPRDLAPLPAAWRFGTFRENASRFCCRIDDHFRVFAFLWLLSHSAQATPPLRRR